MLPNLALVMFDGASSFPLLAIPLFILAGAIMNASSDLAPPDRIHLRRCSASCAAACRW